MSADFTLKKNDTRPAIRIALSSGGAPFSLASTAATPFIASLVKLLGKNQTNPAQTFSGTMTIASALGGVVDYVWKSADSANSGMFNMECEATLSDGGVMTFPEDGYLVLNIVDDLG